MSKIVFELAAPLLDLIQTFLQFFQGHIHCRYSSRSLFVPQRAAFCPGIALHRVSWRDP
jgi:hypothetical protein